jgi:hypothetical protein
MMTAPSDAAWAFDGFPQSIQTPTFVVFKNFAVNRISQNGSPNYMCVVRFNGSKD